LDRLTHISRFEVDLDFHLGVVAVVLFYFREHLIELGVGRVVFNFKRHPFMHRSHEGVCNRLVQKELLKLRGRDAGLPLSVRVYKHRETSKVCKFTIHVNLDEVVFGSELGCLGHGDVESGLVIEDRNFKGVSSFSINLGVKSIQLAVYKSGNNNGEHLVDGVDNFSVVSIKQFLQYPLLKTDLKTANGDSRGRLEHPVDIVGRVNLNECGHSKVGHFEGLYVTADKPKRFGISIKLEVDIDSPDCQHKVVSTVHKF